MMILDDLGPAASQQPPLIGNTLEESIAEAHQIIQQAKETYPHVAVVALFSGGNDSTTLLHLVKDQVDFALHINTGIGIEQTREFARDTCADWRIRLIEKRTDPDDYRLRVIQYGFPGPMQHHLMYKRLKERRLREVQRELGASGRNAKRIILLSGVRTYESERRMGNGYVPTDRKGNQVWVNPLFWWRDWDMYQYRSAHAVPRSPVSDLIHKSGECLCGAYAKRGELDEIEMWFPQAAEYIHAIEAKAKAAGRGRMARWGWGADRLREARPPPGPMCSSCHQVALEEEAV